MDSDIENTQDLKNVARGLWIRGHDLLYTLCIFATYRTSDSKRLCTLYFPI